MPETLLTQSSIKMYGRVVTSLAFTNDTTAFGGNNFLQEQLVATLTVSIRGTTAGGSANVAGVTPNTSQLAIGMPVAGLGIPAGATVATIPTLNSFTVSAAVPAGSAAAGTGAIIATGSPNFARIYAFSFEGAIYSLPKPAMFLVLGPGTSVDARKGGGRTTTDDSGVVAREWEFSGVDPNVVDLRYWEYEKGDFSIRLDTEAGPLEQILLMAALRAGADMADRATGIRSGASLAGASLAGASLSGASLSGASLSGASLSGASLRNGR
jgi:hypothetical protein